MRYRKRKLTKEQEIEAKNRYAKGDVPLTALAKDYGVSYTTMRNTVIDGSRKKSLEHTKKMRYKYADVNIERQKEYARRARIVLKKRRAELIERYFHTSIEKPKGKFE